MKIIVIDPGHGGDDPGAVYGGIKESVLNLKIALNLYYKLGDSFKIELTRGDDTFSPLQKRCDIANNIFADLFISVHCNANVEPKANGFEIEYVSPKGKELAELILAEVFSGWRFVFGPPKNRGIFKRDDLYVLKHTRMPALLLEYGFISNPEEAVLLGNNEYIGYINNKVAQAVLSWFKRHWEV